MINRSTRLAIALTAAMTAAGALLPVQAFSAPSNHIQVSRNDLGATQHVEVGLNKSIIVDLPADASEVIVSNPGMASAIMRSKRRAIVQGVSLGETNIFFLDKSGARIAVFEISITQDSSGLQALLNRLIPTSRILAETVVTPEGQRIVLSGTAQSTDDVNRALLIASQYTGSADTVANVITLNGAQQVALKVTVAEVSREQVKQLGINLNASLNAGALSTTLLNTPALGGASGVVPSGTATLGGSFGGLTLTATLNALERRGAMRTLAEPTLTALSGQEAEFLAGGEFPVPTGVQDGVVEFTFKKFGINLKFTPVVMSNGLITLAVETSVSEPTTEGGFNLNGLTVPATKERTARTSVRLNSGSTLAIAGLIQDQIRQQFNALPGIEKVPILGALFRSRDFVHSQTELVILVTPTLAAPGDPVDLPTDHLEFASDAEAIFLGRMQKLYGVGSPKAANYTGAFGFVLD